MVDASISSYSNTSRHDPSGTSVNVKRRELGNSGYNSSRLGFRGTEDLGGGLAASFWLEAPIKNDDGSEGVATFNRRSTVSLSGGFGEIRLGRDYTPSFWNNTVFDPFGTNGVGTSVSHSASSAYGHPTRASNTVGYFLPPNLGGFYGQVQYGFHEQTKYSPGGATPQDGFKYVVNERTGKTEMVVKAAPDSRTGRYIGGRLGYANGPLDVALALSTFTVDDNYFAGTTQKLNTANLGASYDFGPAKLFGKVSQSRRRNEFGSAFIPKTSRFGDNFFADTANSQTVGKFTGWLLGVTVPVGAGLIRASYSGGEFDFNNDIKPKVNKLALGYVHNLSKRTALYATVARLNNKDGASITVGGPAFYNPDGVFTPKSSTGYDFGIRHAF